MSRRRVKDLPKKRDPKEFGGGRVRGLYTQRAITKLLCSFAGCGRSAWAAWGACCDNNILRPVCAEHDVAMNCIAVRGSGDPEGPAKMTVYVNNLAQEIGRDIELSPEDYDWMYET